MVMRWSVHSKVKFDLSAHLGHMDWNTKEGGTPELLEALIGLCGLQEGDDRRPETPVETKVWQTHAEPPTENWLQNRRDSSFKCLVQA